MKNYLGIDWGKRKIGIATADDELRIAYAQRVITCDTNIWTMIAAIIDEYSITDIIVGIPMHKGHGNDGRGAMMFIDALRAQCAGVSVHTEDEMFTTKMAQAGRRVAGKSGEDDDAQAAQVILQGWLDAKG